MEALGNTKINEIYAEIDLNQILIKGIREKDSYSDMTKNIKDGNSSDYNSFYTEGIKLIKDTRKFGKFNLIIPYGNEIKVATELPVEEENKEGSKTFKFPLARRKRK